MIIRPNGRTYNETDQNDCRFTFFILKKTGYMWTPVDFGIYSTFNRNG